MILLGLAFILVLIFLYDFRKFVYSLIVFFVLFDMFDGFYEDEKVFAVIRYLVPMGLVLFSIFKESSLKKSDTILLIVSLYLLVLLVYSQGDIIVSAKNVLAVLLTLLMIPLGRTIGRRANFIEEFEWYNRFLLFTLPLYIIAANILGFGESYSEAFTTGFLITSRMYIFPIVVFLAIHYVISNKDRNFIKLLDLGLILVNVCIILINTRRTALGMLAAAIVVYAILNRQIMFKMVMIGLILISALVATYPVYEKALTAQLEKRERIQDLESYEEEGRWLETLYIFDHHYRTQSIAEIFFGVKLFDTYDFGTHYFGRDRPIHSDLNMTFYSTGLIGILLFALLIVHYFIRGNKAIAIQSKNIYYPVLIMFLLVLIPGRFIGTLTYAPFLMLILSATKARKSAITLGEISKKRASLSLQSFE